MNHMNAVKKRKLATAGNLTITLQVTVPAPGFRESPGIKSKKN
jgi:hypothetical protein